MSQEIEDALLELVEKGLVDVTYNEDLEALFSITEKGLKVMQSLPNEVQW